MPTTPTAPAPSAPRPLVRQAVLRALANEDRWKVVVMLADGRTLSVSEVATALGRRFDGVSKTLIVLCDAGVIQAYRGTDGRNTVYQMPSAFRATPGVLDFGFCRLTLP